MNANTKELIGHIEDLRRQARWWRLGATLGCLAVSVIFLLILRHQALKLVNPGPTRSAFLHHFGEGLQRDVLPEVRDLGVTTAHALSPRLRAEWERFQQRAPDLAERLTVELELFQRNLPARAEQVLVQVFHETFAGRLTQLRARFPELTDDRLALLSGLVLTEAETRLRKVAAEIGKPYEAELAAIVTDLEHIRLTESPATATEEPAWELARFCAQWFEAELQHTAQESAVGQAVVATVLRASQP